MNAADRQAERFYGWMFLAPAFFGFVVFAFAPLMRSVWMSFTEWNMLSDPRWVGSDNYAKMLGDDIFWESLGRTALYVVMVVPLQTFLALVLAVLLHALTKSALIRSILILPYLVSGVTASLIWLVMLHPSLGYTNQWLISLGIGAQGFFGDFDQALATVAMVNIWRTVGYTSLFFFAGLQSIPVNLYEAAKVDGAGPVTQFWRITVPLLRPIIAFVLVTGIIGSFQIFDTIAVTSQGGPGNATTTIMWYIYDIAFTRFNMGYATALSLMLLLIVVAVSAIQIIALRANRSDLS